MKNVPLLLGTIIGTIVLVVAIALFFSRSSQPTVADPAVLMNSTVHAKGPEQAKITIVEFSDLQCPACRAVQPIVRQVLSQYPNDVRFVYRHFPLFQIHKNAQVAARASEAAADQGKFWEFHDLLFERQDDWAELSDQDVRAKFIEYADELAIDKTQFQQKIDSQEVRDRVNVDVSDANKLNVDSTPTFYVNGQKTLAPQLLSTVESVLQSTAK